MLFKFVILLKPFQSHHETMAHHAIDEFVEFDETIEAVLNQIHLSETLVVVTADHRSADF